MVIAELLLQRMLARYRFVFLVGEFPLFGEAELSVFGQVRMYRLEVLVDWGLVNGWLFVVVFLVTIVRGLALCCRWTMVLKPSCLKIRVNGKVRQMCRDNRKAMVSAIDPEILCVQGET